jgi:hypothetical protein
MIESGPTPKIFGNLSSPAAKIHPCNQKIIKFNLFRNIWILTFLSDGAIIPKSGGDRVWNRIQRTGGSGTGAALPADPGGSPAPLYSCGGEGGPPDSSEVAITAISPHFAIRILACCYAHHSCKSIS